MPTGKSIMAAVAVGALAGALYATWNTVQVAVGQAPTASAQTAADSARALVPGMPLGMAPTTGEHSGRSR
jgi:hypothetical protein